MSFSFQDFSYEFPLFARLQEPAWKARIERWYQMDEISRALCDAVYSWLQQNPKISFDRLIFVGEQGSNLADADYLNSGTFSPSKFIYTLPSIGPSMISQLLDWKGPITYLGVTTDLAMTLKLAEEIAEKHVTNQNQGVLILSSPSQLHPGEVRKVNARLCQSDTESSL